MQKFICTLQKIDGENKITLPSGVSARDFEDWMNKKSYRKNLEIVELPERWISAEDDFMDVVP